MCRLPTADVDTNNFDSKRFSSRMNAQAFASGIPLTSARHPYQVVLRRSYTKWSTPSRAITQACLPPNGDSPSPPIEKGTSSMDLDSEAITKTEQIAALLGQSKASMTESANKIKEQTKLDNRRKYGFALASTVVATSFFLAEKLNPNAGVNLLRFLESTSAPISVVGTNDKPSLIEFGATWCENCKLMAKSIFELEGEYAGAVNFLVIDGDDPNNGDIIERFGVDGIPQFSLIGRNGEVKGNLIGRVPKIVLEQDLDALLEDKPMPFPGLSTAELAEPNS